MPLGAKKVQLSQSTAKMLTFNKQLTDGRTAGYDERAWYCCCRLPLHQSQQDVACSVQNTNVKRSNGELLSDALRGMLRRINVLAYTQRKKNSRF